MERNHLPPEYWTRRIAEVTQEMITCAHDQHGAQDSEALRKYLQWLRKMWFRVAPADQRADRFASEAS